MLKTSSLFARVSPIQAINSTRKHQRNSSDTSSNTSTGHHSKWSQHAWKSPQQETLQDKSLDIEASASKSSVNDMLTLLMTCRLWLEKHDCKTQRIDKTPSNWNRQLAMQCYKTNGEISNSSSSNLQETHTSGLSIRV